MTSTYYKCVFCVKEMVFSSITRLRQQTEKGVETTGNVETVEADEEDFSQQDVALQVEEVWRRSLGMDRGKQGRIVKRMGRGFRRK